MMKEPMVEYRSCLPSETPGSKCMEMSWVTGGPRVNRTPCRKEVCSEYVPRLTRLHTTEEKLAPTHQK